MIRSGPHFYIAAITTGQRLHAGFQRSGCLGRAACRIRKIAGVWLFAAAAGPAKAAPKVAAAAAAPKQCCEVSMSESDVGSQAECSNSKSQFSRWPELEFSNRSAPDHQASIKSSESARVHEP